MQRLLIAAVFCGLASQVHAAEPGLATEVYEPTVTQGETEFELRGGVLDGGEANADWQVKAEAAYSVNDWWRPALVAEWEYEGSDAEFTAFAIENVIDLTATRDWPVHFGAYVEYEFAQDGPDGVELKLLMQRTRGPWDLRLNLIGEREVGSDAADEWEFGYAVQVGYALSDDMQIGVQGFGEAGDSESLGLGDRAAYWGPFAEFDIGDVGAGELEMQIGYLAGFGDAAADGQFRIKLDLEFPAR